MKKLVHPIAIVFLLICFGLAWPTRGDSGTGGLRFTVMVHKFQNNAGGGGFELGDSWRSIMTAALDQSGSFMVVGEIDMRGAAGEEQAFGASGLAKLGNSTPQRGQMTPAQLLVKGEITHYKSESAGQNGGLGYKGIKIGGGKSTAEIHATIYMVDSATGMVIGSKNVKGISSSKSRGISFERDGVSGSFGHKTDSNPIDAMKAAVDEAVAWMVGRLPSVIWRGEVLVVREDGTVVVNRGTREGVQSGATFTVGEYEILRDPDSGEVLDVSMTERATVQAVQVKEKTSICKVVSGNGGTLVKGMGLVKS